MRIARVFANSRRGAIAPHKQAVNHKVLAVALSELSSLLVSGLRSTHTLSYTIRWLEHTALGRCAMRAYGLRISHLP